MCVIISCTPLFGSMEKPLKCRTATQVNRHGLSLGGVSWWVTWAFRLIWILESITMTCSDKCNQTFKCFLRLSVTHTHTAVMHQGDSFMRDSKYRSRGCKHDPQHLSSLVSLDQDSTMWKWSLFHVTTLSLSVPRPARHSLPELQLLLVISHHRVM